MAAQNQPYPLSNSSSTGPSPLQTAGIYTNFTSQPSPLLSTSFQNSPGSSPAGIAVDASGDLFVAENAPGTVEVIPSASGQLYGESVTAGTPTTIMSGLNKPTGVTVDPQGDVFVTEFGSGAVSVLPARSGNLFGVSVQQDVQTTLLAAKTFEGPTGIALDASGNLYVSNAGASEIEAVAPTSTTLFGTSVPADQPTPVVTSTMCDEPTGLAFDSAGNLYFANYGNGTIAVMDNQGSTIFGQNLTAASIGTLATNLKSPTGISLYSTGELFIAETGNSSIDVIAPYAETIDGVPVNSNTPSPVVVQGANAPEGIVAPSVPTQYFANNGSGTVTKLTS